MNDRYLVALEISSSKIIAAIGKTSFNGELDIIAIEQETDVDGIRYGIIQNLEETSMCVSRLFGRLEQRAGVTPRKIKGVIVGLSGRSLRNIPTEVAMPLPEETEIDDNILLRLRNQAMQSAIDNTLEVIDAVPRTYRVGKIETLTPKGMIGNAITGVFDLIVCRPEMTRNIRRTICDKLHLQLEGFVVTAMAAAHLILTSDEKDLGCMLVDAGSQTTTVSIYKNGGLRYFSTLPMGGHNITRDIMSLGVIEARAEEIKKTSGNAFPEDSKPSTLNIGGIRLSDVANLVTARREEIVANIVEQISYAGMKETDLSKGIICIGGAARLQGFTALLSQQSDLPVRMGNLPDYVKFNGIKPLPTETVEVISVLYAGATLSEHECLEMPEKEALPVNGELQFEETETPEETKPEKPKLRNKFLEGLGRKITNMFGNSEDDSDLI